LGLPPDIKLSRSEWSYVRRRMKNKPRRFSNHFVRSQLKSLEAYRNTVRGIQRSPKDSSLVPADFGYEGSFHPSRFSSHYLSSLVTHMHHLFVVLTPITVGSTVTAFNKRTKLLHRGVVLSRRTYQSNAYVIQFERKELGFEFCLDIDIASHGVKEVLLPAKPPGLQASPMVPHLGMNTTNLGELAYGSTYGTVLNFNIGMTKDTLRNFYLGKNSTRVVTEEDKATEKEILVKLMFMMDSSLKRKARILKTIEKFNKIISSCEKRSQESASTLLSRPGNKSFRDHYVWLKESLASTNHVIKTCLYYLQIMYDQAYSSGAHNTTKDQIANVRPRQNQPPVHYESMKAWKKCMKTGFVDCGAMIADSIQKRKIHDNGLGSNHASNSIDDDGSEKANIANHQSNLTGCLSKASSLLFATELSRKSILQSGNDKIMSGSIIQSILSDARNNLQPIPPPTDIPVHFGHILRKRDLGHQALSEAFSMLEGELGHMLSNED